MQECQPLGDHLPGEKIDAGRIAARPGKAGDETKLDRVLTDAEDDRDRRSRSFGAIEAASLPGVAITATRRRTKSVISAGWRSNRPSR
jgi:hypothetical protein